MGCCGVDYTNTSAEDLLNAYTDEEARAHAEEVGVDPRPNETISEIDETGAASPMHLFSLLVIKKEI